MKHGAIILAIVGFSLTSLPAISQPATHVVLISIDGLHPDMYLDSSWPAPNLRQLMKEGTYADHMLSVFPAYTYPAHTAMLTGALPARSKIVLNQPKGSKGEWNWFARYIQVPTLWQVLRKAGLTTAAIEWPVSVDTNITYDIPEIWDIKHPEDRITETRRYATPRLVEEIEKEATGKLDSANMSEEYFSMDDNSARMASYIFATYRPAFLAVHFAEVDGMEHAYGRDADSVRLAVEAADRAVGVPLEAVRRSAVADRTAVIIVGDHGFSTSHNVFRPNMLIKDVPARFIAAGGSAFLYLLEATSKTDTLGTIKAVTAALDGLPSDKRKLFRIIGRSELGQMGADSSALLALSAVPGVVFGGSISANAVFEAAHGGHHGYDPRDPLMYTGFIAAGAGILQGGHIKELCVTDIAPLVARLLGVAFICPDGKIVPGILTNEFGGRDTSPVVQP